MTKEEMELREEIEKNFAQYCTHDSCTFYRIGQGCKNYTNCMKVSIFSATIINRLSELGYGKMVENNPDLPYVIGKQFQPIERVK